MLYFFSMLFLIYNNYFNKIHKKLNILNNFSPFNVIPKLHKKSIN